MCKINNDSENYLCDDGELSLKLKKAIYGYVMCRWYEMLRKGSSWSLFGFTMIPTIRVYSIKIRH